MKRRRLGSQRVLKLAAIAAGFLVLATLSTAAATPPAQGKTGMMSAAHQKSVLHYSVSTARTGAMTVRVSGPAVVRVRGNRPVTLRGPGVVALHGPRALIAANYNCTVTAITPYWAVRGRLIYGPGSQFCSGSGWAPQRVRVAVQWYLGLGFWSNKARNGSSFTNQDFTSYTTPYSCVGTGTHTYRTAADGYSAGGAVVVTEDSSAVVATCDAR